MSGSRVWTLRDAQHTLIPPCPTLPPRLQTCLPMRMRCARCLLRVRRCPAAAATPATCTLIWPQSTSAQVGLILLLFVGEIGSAAAWWHQIHHILLVPIPLPGKVLLHMPPCLLLDTHF